MLIKTKNSKLRLGYISWPKKKRLGYIKVSNKHLIVNALNNGIMHMVTIPFSQ